MKNCFIHYNILGIINLLDYIIIFFCFKKKAVTLLLSSFSFNSNRITCLLKFTSVSIVEEVAEYPTIKADDRGTDIVFRTLLLPQLPQNNLYKREKENKNYRTVCVSEIAIFVKVAIQLKGAEKIQTFGKKTKNIKMNLFHSKHSGNIFLWFRLPDSRQ